MIRINVAAPGLPVLTCPNGATVTLTDTGSAPVSRVWEIEVWPDNQASPPALSPSSTASPVTFPGSAGDGCYQIKLTRVEGDGSTTIQKTIVGVLNVDGLVFPSPNMDPAILLQISASAALDGWAGSTRSGTEVLLAAIVRNTVTRLRAVEAFNAGGTIAATPATLALRDSVGAIRSDRTALGVTNTLAVAGLILANLTAGANGAPQHSPPSVLSGNVWDGSGAVSRAVDWSAQARGVDGSPATSKLVWSSDIGHAGLVDRLSITNAGVLGLLKSIQFPVSGSPSISQADATSGVGQTLSINAQRGFAGSAGGILHLTGGAGGTSGVDVAGAIEMDLGALVSGNSATLAIKSGLTNYFTVAIVGSSTVLSAPSSALQLVGFSYVQLVAPTDDLYLDSHTTSGTPTIHMRGNAAAESITISYPHAGAQSITHSRLATSVLYTQATNTTDVTCHDLTIAAQAPWSSATGAFRTGGNLILQLADPTNTGTGIPLVKTKQGSVQTVAFGGYSLASGFGCFWGGSATPTQQNFAFLGDGATNGSAYFNAPNGGTMYLSFNGTAADGLSLTASLLKSIIPTWKFDAAVTGLISQVDASSGAGKKLTIRGQKGGASSIGGAVRISGGTATGPSSVVAGAIELDLGTTTDTLVSAKLKIVTTPSGGSESSILDIYQSTTDTMKIEMGRLTGIITQPNPDTTSKLILHCNSGGGDADAIVLRFDNPNDCVATIIASTGGSLAFYGGTPAQIQTRAGQLTDNTTGTPSGTLAVLTSGTVWATDSTIVKNWAASLAAKINSLETIINNLHLTN